MAEAVPRDPRDEKQAHVILARIDPHPPGSCIAGATHVRLALVHPHPRDSVRGAGEIYDQESLEAQEARAKTERKQVCSDRSIR